MEVRWEHEARLRAELARLEKLPPASLYATHRRKVVKRALELVRKKIYTDDDVKELEFLIQAFKL